jgi:hypothetical protein
MDSERLDIFLINAHRDVGWQHCRARREHRHPSFRSPPRRRAAVERRLAGHALLITRYRWLFFQRAGSGRGAGVGRALGVGVSLGVGLTAKAYTLLSPAI